MPNSNYKCYAYIYVVLNKQKCNTTLAEASPIAILSSLERPEERYNLFFLNGKVRSSNLIPRDQNRDIGVQAATQTLLTWQ